MWYELLSTTSFQAQNSLQPDIERKQHQSGELQSLVVAVSSHTIGILTVELFKLLYSPPEVTSEVSPAEQT